jgi:ABC-2 type transport system permease protein
MRGRLRQILRKEIIQMVRDRATFGLMVVTPVLQLLIYGYVATLDLNHIPFVLCDLDRSQQSRELVERFTTSGYFELLAVTEVARGIDPFLDQGRARFALVIPPEYSRDLKSGRTAPLQLVVDGTNSNTATLVLAYADTIINEAAARFVLERMRRAGGGLERELLQNETRVWYNPDLKSINYMVPGVICVLLLQVLTPLTSMNIVREKERGTIEQLRVTPIRPSEMILGKTLPGVIVGFANVMTVLVVGRYWFGVPLRGSVLFLLFASGLFIVSALALGLFISTLADTQQQALFTAIFFMIPNILLSGFMFPISSMPRAMQVFTYLIPMRYFLVIVRGIFLKGIGPTYLWPQLLALAGFGSVLLALSIWRFDRAQRE